MDMLHVFTDDEDTIIARDEEDAWQVWFESCGERREDYETEEPRWTKRPDDAELTIWNEDVPSDKCDCLRLLAEHAAVVKYRTETIQKLPVVARQMLRKAIDPDAPRTFPNGHLRSCPLGSDTKTCAEWAKQEGRGFLCSTNA